MEQEKTTISGSRKSHGERRRARAGTVRPKEGTASASGVSKACRTDKAC